MMIKRKPTKLAVTELKKIQGGSNRVQKDFRGAPVAIRICEIVYWLTGGDNGCKKGLR